jgi:hypothetical protein
MGDAEFPKPVAEVIATLTEIFRHQREMQLVELLESSHASLDNTHYDNYNGGTYTWVLRLDVPVHLFASIEPRLSEIEEQIQGKATYFTRGFPNDHLGAVVIAPIPPGAQVLYQRTEPPETELRSLWSERRFRLFLSHLAKHKAAVSDLKRELENFGISAFVAHEAIKPSLEWQREIELALRSMHSLAALLTPEFQASDWTDQEIGWALGRGVLVLPVRLGIDPYGFAGKIQGISGNLARPRELAKSLFETLLTNPQTHGEARRAFVVALCDSSSYSQSILLRDYVPQILDFTDEEKVALRKACEKNSQIAQAYMVTEVIYNTVGEPSPPTKPPEVDDVPF